MEVLKGVEAPCEGKVKGTNRDIEQMGKRYRGKARNLFRCFGVN